MRMNAPRLVQVEWVDSRQPTVEWRRVDDLNYLSECRCTSVGFLLYDGDQAKVLAASIADEDEKLQATGVFVIPTAAVLSLRTLTQDPEPEASAANEDRHSHLAGVPS